jgi:hypothetical protein
MFITHMNTVVIQISKFDQTQSQFCVCYRAACFTESSGGVRMIYVFLNNSKNSIIFTRKLRTD